MYLGVLGKSHLWMNIRAGTSKKGSIVRAETSMGCARANTCMAGEGEEVRVC